MSQKTITFFEDDKEITYQDDFYSENQLEEMFEDDSISGGEYGFMIGYLDEEEQAE
jgi:hypothetical protein